jgi:hypothetical protein
LGYFSHGVNFDEICLGYFSYGVNFDENCLGYFSHGVNFDKICLGYILGIFFHELVRSPWSKVARLEQEGFLGLSVLLDASTDV